MTNQLKKREMHSPLLVFICMDYTVDVKIYSLSIEVFI